MKRFKLLSVVLLCLLSLPGQAQLLDTKFQQFYTDFEHLKNFEKAASSNYDGSPYLDNEFRSGSIILLNEKRYDDILLRYNIFSDLFEFSKDGEALALEKSNQFNSFTIGKKIFRYSSYKYGGKERKGYLELIIEGQYSLYIKHNIILREAQEAGAYREATKAIFYIQKPTLLIGKGLDKIVEMNNAKDFLNTFEGLEKSIKDYKGKQKLKLKTQNDYIDLVNFLNSI